MSLYTLSLELETLLQNEDATDEQIETAFGNLTEKAEGVCKFLAMLDGEIDLFKGEGDRLSARRKALENKRDRVREYIKSTMQMLMIEALNAGTFKLSVQPTAGKVVVTDEASLDPKYYRVEEVFTVDRNQIKADIKSGLLVPGAYIEEGSSLRVR